MVVRSGATVGVVHVVLDPTLRSVVPCGMRRAYSHDEQVENLDLLALDDDVFRVRVLGDPELDWTLDFSTDPPSETLEEASCTLELEDRQDLHAVITGDDPQLGLKLYFQGRMRISGDVLAATRLPILAARLRCVPAVVRAAGQART